jgi:hypothetical protein
MKKYILIDAFERELGTPEIFDTEEAALAAMARDIASILEIDPKEIQEAIAANGEYTRGEECEVYERHGWVNGRCGDSDFLICELDTKTWRCFG